MNIIKIGDPNIIMDQLGNNKFIAMTGSKVAGGYDNDGYAYITMRLQRNMSKARYLDITLNGKDLYDMEFRRSYKGELIEVETFNDVYGDMLQIIFTDVTGMYTRL